MVNIKNDYRISYAQNREDIILAGFFNDVKEGFYVDIGANDPELESVTKYFYDQGWSGINIEPQTGHFKSLEKRRKRDINLNIGIAEKKGNLTLRQYKGDGLSTFSVDMQKEYSVDPTSYTTEYVDVSVKVSTLRDVFNEYSVGIINFMKVDVEGFEYEVLAGNDWKKWRPQVICIEMNHIKKDWHRLLKANDYELSFFDGLNEYFTDSHNSKIKENFSYVDSILLGKPIISQTIANLINEDSETIKKLTTQLAALTEENTKLQEEFASVNAHDIYLQNELNEIASLKGHIKKFTKKKVQQLNQKIEGKLQPSKIFEPVKPPQSDNLLEASHQTDVQNLHKYNLTFTENSKLRLYRKVKRITKHILKRGKFGD